MWPLVVNVLSQILRELQRQTDLLRQMQVQQGALLTNIQAQEATLLQEIKEQVTWQQEVLDSLNALIKLLTPPQPSRALIVFGIPVHN
jgi:hypothetical protein